MLLASRSFATSAQDSICSTACRAPTARSSAPRAAGAWRSQGQSRALRSAEAGARKPSRPRGRRRVGRAEARRSAQRALVPRLRREHVRALRPGGDGSPRCRTRPHGRPAAAARRRQRRHRRSPPAPPAPSLAAGTTLSVSSTAYSLPGHTASGLPVGQGICATDPRVIPLGTRFDVPGYGSCVAADTGSAVIGATIDIWMPGRAGGRVRDARPLPSLSDDAATALHSCSRSAAWPSRSPPRRPRRTRRAGRGTRARHLEALAAARPRRKGHRRRRRRSRDGRGHLPPQRLAAARCRPRPRSSSRASARSARCGPTSASHTTVVGAGSRGGRDLERRPLPRRLRRPDVLERRHRRARGPGPGPRHPPHQRAHPRRRDDLRRGALGPVAARATSASSRRPSRASRSTAT